MRVISIGDLVTDYYYKNGKLIGVNGGMTSHNIIANLAKMKIDTSVYGVCGNDMAGIIAIKSLEDIGVDTKNIRVLDNVKTRCFHISYNKEDDKLTFTSKKRCPVCSNKKWYDKSLIDTKEVIEGIKLDDILVFDNLNDVNLEIINNSSNKKVIDLGQYFEFESLSEQVIIDKIKNKFEIINFNERVSKFLLNKLNLDNDVELYNLLQAKLIIITKGKKGARFIFDNEVLDFELKEAALEVDSTGAGDAFFSSIIKNYLKNDLVITKELIPIWYEKATALTSRVVKKMGARGHINSLYKIKQKDDICTCNDFELVIRKQIKRCNININNLKTRVINAVNSNAIMGLNNINFNEKENYLFIGTGGSYAGARFASIVINELEGANTYAMLPRDVIYRNNKKIDKVILFSYSGTTNDLIEATIGFSSDKKFVITKGEVAKVSLKTNISKDNIITYRTSANKGRERGFLSFEGVIAPASLFLKYYFKGDNNFKIDEFISNSIDYWNEFFENCFQKIETKGIFQNANIINIFTGDYTNCASADLESKIIESGIINCIVHEKKNFSHGRFINYENLNNKKSIYLKQNITNEYEKLLLNYINDNDNIIIESRYNGILCEFDLLIASQLLIYYVGKILDIDVSKPKYLEEAMKIYFYKGSL